MKLDFFSDFQDAELAEDSSELECGGDDSGNNACWDDWLNIGVPILCTLLLTALLIILYIFPNQSNLEEEDKTAKYTKTENDTETVVVVDPSQASSSVISINMDSLNCTSPSPDQPEDKCQGGVKETSLNLPAMNT